MNRANNKQNTLRLNSYLLIFVIFNVIFFYLLDKSRSLVANIDIEYFVFSSIITLSLLINYFFKSVALELLNTIIVIFYHFRFTTLIFFSDASVMVSRGVDVSNIPVGVLHLSYNFAALALATIIILPRVSFNINNRTKYVPEIIIRRILYFILFVILAQILSVLFIGGPGERNLGYFRIIFTILSEDNVILLLLSIVFLVHKELLIQYKKIIYLIFALFIGHYIFMGNKSALAILLLYYLIVSLYSRGVISFSIRQFIKIGLLAALTVILFEAGYYFRVYHASHVSSNIAIELFLEQGASIVNSLEFFLSRIGWLDYFLDSILTQSYEEFVNLAYYFKSIVDGMTIGFDVFNAEFMSRMLHYTINNGNFNDGFKSDQLTVFAEGQIIFGYLSPILYFVILSIFFIMFKANIFKNPLSSLLYGVIVFQGLFQYFAGFGIDMLVVNDLLYKLIFLLIINIVFLGYSEDYSEKKTIKDKFKSNIV